MEKRSHRRVAMRILIVKFSAIGDCVMAGWIARDLRLSYPEATIDWVVDERNAEVINGEIVTNVLPLPRKQWKSKGEFRTLFAQYRWHCALREHSYDYGFDLQGHSKTAWCLRLAGVKNRVASRATDAIARSLNPQMPRSQPDDLHIIEWNSEVVNHLLRTQTGNHEILAGELAYRNPRLITICVGAGHPTKKIPPSTLSELGAKLAKRGYEVTYLGGKNDHIESVPNTKNMVGETSLTETIQLIRQSALHISGDTGTAHIAAATHTPQVTVFGPMNPNWYRPYSDLCMLLNREGNPALIDSDEILDASLARLGAS
jgi:ADP-heptose:LPS heptosyltransferase